MYKTDEVDPSWPRRSGANVWPLKPSGVRRAGLWYVRTRSRRHDTYCFVPGVLSHGCVVLDTKSTRRRRRPRTVTTHTCASGPRVRQSRVSNDMTLYVYYITCNIVRQKTWHARTDCLPNGFRIGFEIDFIFRPKSTRIVTKCMYLSGCFTRESTSSSEQAWFQNNLTRTVCVLTVFYSLWTRVIVVLGHGYDQKRNTNRTFAAVTLDLRPAKLLRSPKELIECVYEKF